MQVRCKSLKSGSCKNAVNASVLLVEAEVAQLVEQPIRNRQVPGSSPGLGSNPLQITTRSVRQSWFGNIWYQLRSNLIERATKIFSHGVLMDLRGCYDAQTGENVGHKFRRPLLQ